LAEEAGELCMLLFRLLLRLLVTEEALEGSWRKS
jgi:hypothetical protein